MAQGAERLSNQRSLPDENKGDVVSSLSPDERQAIFDQAYSDLDGRGLIGDHEINFVNEFALAKLNTAGDITDVKTFSSLSTLADARTELGWDWVQVNGGTTVGDKSSIVYAGATLPRRGSIAVQSFNQVLSRPVNLSSVESARFTILHEIQHGKGIVSEARANRGAWRQLRE